MTRNATHILLAAVLLVGLTTHGGSAAELQLKADCRVAGTIVTLGDVAEIAAADSIEAASLARIELFPTPIAGSERFLRVRQVQDLLHLRGVNLLECRFSGVALARITAAELPKVEEVQQTEPRKTEPVVSRISQGTVRSVRLRAERAVMEYLKQRVSSQMEWKLDVRLTEPIVRALEQAPVGLVARGGQAPWEGTQRFELYVNGLTETVLCQIEVELSLPSAVVVAARSLAQGARVRSSDVRLERVETSGLRAGTFDTPEDVIGQEVVHSIREGRVIEPNAIQPPVLVRRGEVIAVTAVAGGIRVSTRARARDDGCQDEVIELETIETRERLVARVCGMQQAEVMARPVSTESFEHRLATPATPGRVTASTIEMRTYPNQRIQ